MKNLKILCGLLALAVTMGFIYSCAKDNEPTKVIKDQNLYLQAFKSDILKIVEKMDLVLIENQNESNSNNECTDPNINDCEGPFLYTTTVTYRGCPFTVTGEVFFCPDLITGNTYLSIKNITGITYDWFYNPDCTTILYEWVGLWLNQQTEALNDSIDTWQYAIVRGWEANFVNQYILNSTSQSYFCDQPQIDANVLVEYYTGTCYQRCINYSEKDGLTWQDLRCGFGCCKRATNYCVDRTSGKLISSTSIEVITNCNYDPEPYPGCQYLSECRQNCSKIK